METCEYVRQMDRAGKIADSPEIGDRRPPRPCDTSQKRDFA